MAGFFAGPPKRNERPVHRRPGVTTLAQWQSASVLGHAIIKKFSTYVELATGFSTAAHTSLIGTVDTALVYQPVDNWQVDVGANIGVTKAANDVFAFVGAAWRY